MANWALVEDKEIKELHDLLPKNWKNISGLNNSKDDLQLLKTLGWFSVVKHYQTYDDSIYEIGGYAHEIVDDSVIETLILREKSIEIPIPETTFEELKAKFMDELRQKRNMLLSQCDWTQLADTQLLFDEETKTKWLVYRQALRDLPESYANNEILYISNVVFPTV